MAPCAAPWARWRRCTPIAMVVVEPGATLVGRVVDDASNAPAVAVEVYTRLPGQRRASATTDPTGAFTLRGVPAGEKVRVSAVSEAARTTGFTEVAVPRLGATVEVGTLRLRPREAPPPAPEARATRCESMTRTGPGASRPAHSPSACR